MARIGRFMGMAAGPYGAALSTVQPVDNLFPVAPPAVDPNARDGPGSSNGIPGLDPLGNAYNSGQQYTWMNATGGVWDGISANPVLYGSYDNKPVNLHQNDFVPAQYLGNSPR